VMRAFADGDPEAGCFTPLHPRWNARSFGSEVPCSIKAASRWLGASIPVTEVSVYSVLLDRLTSAELDALEHVVLQAEDVRYRVNACRCWITGSWSGLGQLVRALPEQYRELGDAILTSYVGTPLARRRTLVMGILNVTPDSFSDGGQWLDVDAAVEHGLRMVDDGAEVIDVGGESTRPGAVEVPAEEELRRVLPVVQRLRTRTKAEISIDTRKSTVAEACLDAGVDWINDVSALTYDPALADVAAKYPACKLVLMHSRARGDAEVYSTEWDERGRPVYEDVVADTLRWLRTQALLALERGVSPRNLWIDPGFGFGKTYEQNLELLRRVREYTSTLLPVLVGTSRKSSVGKMLGDLPPDERLEGTAATVAWAVSQGAAAVRVHDVKEMARVVRVAELLRSSDQ
jgi:dihydropteroate synthase